MGSSINKALRELRSKINQEVKTRDSQLYSVITPEIMKGTLLFFLICILFISILLTPASGLWLLLWGGLGVVTFLFIVNTAHDASHKSLFKSDSKNEVALLLPFALLGIDGYLWGLRHRGAHHPHTNISGEDTDSLPNPFLRLSPHHPWRPQFRFQHFYAPFLYALALPHTAFFQDFEHLLLRPLPYLKKIDSLKGAWIRLLSIKMIYLVIFAGLPIFTGGHTLSAVLLGIAIQQIAASLVFVFTICLNHYVCETTFFIAHPGHSHLTHQLIASADWNPTSRFCGWIMGGANAHTAHHLFPSIPHRHYWWISEKIQQFCTEHSLPYNSFSFSQGLRSHFRFLQQLGRRPS